MFLGGGGQEILGVRGGLLLPLVHMLVDVLGAGGGILLRQGELTSPRAWLLRQVHTSIRIPIVDQNSDLLRKLRPEGD